MTECELGTILISDLNEKGITNIFQEVVVDGGESCDRGNQPARGASGL